MEIILCIFYTIFFLLVIFKWDFFEISKVSRFSLSGFFLLKILAGVTVWAVYTYHYTYRPTADAFKYFDASDVLFNSLFSHPLHFFKMFTGIDGNNLALFIYYDKMNFWLSSAESSIYNDSHLIIRTNTLIRFFSFGYYQVHVVFFSFISFIGLTALFKALNQILNEHRNLLLLIVFCIPSVLFWGSGVLKEGLILAALGIFIYQLTRGLSLNSFLLGCLSALFLAILKFYVFVSIIPSILFLFIVVRWGTRYLFLKYTLVLLVIVVFGLNVNRFIPIKNPLLMLSEKQGEFNKLVNGELVDAYYKPVPPASSTIEISRLEPTLLSLLSNSPMGFINAFLRPFPSDVKSGIVFLAFLENLLILVFIFYCIRQRMSLKKVEWKYVIASISFVVIQFVIIGTTTPIIGAIVRYKIPAIPFLLFSFLLLVKPSGLPHKSVENG